MIAGRLFMLAAAALCLGSAMNNSAKAQSYPDKPIKLIVSSAAGGPNDFAARLAAQILTPKLGQPVVVENRPGAGGAIAAREVARAKPDGYTLLLGNTSTMAVIPAVSASAGYDPVKQFTPIVKITEAFQILVVHPLSQWVSVKQLVEFAKAHPFELNYAHGGPGGLPHLAGELFMLRAGVSMTGVPFRGGGDSVNAVLSRAVDLTFEDVGILASQIQAGTLRALAAETGARSKLLPGVPTMAEAGFPNVEANTFFGLVAPAGAPAHVVHKLNEALNDGMQSSEIQALISTAGSEFKANSPEEFASYIALQRDKWVEVGQAAGVRIN